MIARHFRTLCIAGTGACVLALSLLAATNGLAATSKPTPLTKDALTELKFISPKARLITSNSVRVVVRVPSNTKTFRAVSGGKVISKRFVSRGATTRIANLPVGKILQRGVNHVNVLVTTRSGGKSVGDVRFIVAAKGKPAATANVVAQSTRYLVQLKLADTADHFVVKLNGKSITSRFSRHRTNRQSLPISPDEGLRFGANTLEVTTALSSGRYLRKKIKFRVSNRHPLASAGKDRRARAGDSLKLDARSTRPHSGGVKFRWVVKSAPKGAKPTLLRATSSRPTLKVNRPGKYKLELSATGKRKRGSDVVTVSATPNVMPIGASIRTMAPYDGGYAIEVAANCVGGTTSCGKIVSPFASGKPVQLLVLDRSTLSVYRTLQFTGSQGDALVALGILNSLAGTGSQVDYIGILSAPAGQAVDPGWRLPIAELTGTGPVIGGNGGWSAIGVPGQNFAAADTITGTVNNGAIQGLGLGQGEMTGNFSYDDVEEVFNYVTGKANEYQTSTKASTPTQNVMSVGGSTYASAALEPGCTGGFQLVTVRAQTMAPPTDLPGNQTFSTNCSNTGVGDIGLLNLNGAVQNVTPQFAPAADGTLLVFLQSIGSPFPTTQSIPYGIAMPLLASNIQQLGGTADTLMAASNNNAAGYALAGSTTLQSESPARSRAQVFAPEATALQPGSGTTLSGLHTYNRFSNFQPTSGSPTASRIGLLNQIAYQAPSQWPVGNTTGEKNALAYASELYDVQYSSGSSCYKPVQPDIRFEYCDLNAPWSTVLSELPNQPYSKDCSCSTTDWTNVKKYIPQEIRWVQRIYKYIGIIQEIYGLGDGEAGILGVKKIANEVNNVINPPKGADAGGWWTDLIANIANGLSVLAPEDSSLEKVAESISALAYLATDALTEPYGSHTLGQIVKTEVADLPREAAERYRAASIEFGHFGDLVVTDYEKLKAVGTSTNIQLDETTVGQAAGQMMVGVYRFAYRHMLSTAYDTLLLPPNTITPNATTPNEYKCFQSFNGQFAVKRPFSSIGDGAWSAVQRNDPPTGTNSTPAPWFYVWAEKGDSTLFSPPTPPTSLVGNLQKPIAFNGNGIPTQFGEYGPWLFTQTFKQVPYPCTM